MGTDLVVDHLSMGTKFVGDHLSRGIDFMGIVCPRVQEVGDWKSGTGSQEPEVGDRKSGTCKSGTGSWRPEVWGRKSRFGTKGIAAKLLFTFHYQIPCSCRLCLLLAGSWRGHVSFATTVTRRDRIIS